MNGLENYLVKILEFRTCRLLTFFPIDFIYKIARLVGKLLYLLNINKTSTKLREVMSTVLNGLPQKDVDVFVEKNIQESIVFFVDMLFLAWLKEKQIDSLLTRINVKGLENLEEALTKGRGVIVVSAHLGCFYYIFLVLCREFKNLKIGVIKRDSRKIVTQIYNNVCCENQVEDIILGPDAGLKAYSYLRRGGIVGAMFDYAYEDTNLTLSNFLGHPAITPFGITTISVKFNIPVVPVFSIRQPDERMKIEFMKTLWPIEGKDRNENVFLLTERLNKIISQKILQHPEQWDLWRTLDYRWNFWKDPNNMVITQ